MFEAVGTGRLIVFEGPDGVGKSTLSQALAGRLKAMGLTCDHLSFPGKEEGTIGHLVYDVHHEPASFGLNAIADISLQALHIAAHLDEIEQRILPALQQGRWVVLDRFWWSTWVYGRATSVETSTLDALIQAERLHWHDIKPDALFLVDRFNDEVDQEDRAPLRQGYQVLSDGEKGQHPIHRIQNDGTVEDSLGQMLALLRDIVPGTHSADPTDLPAPEPGSSEQLPLLSPRPRPRSPSRHYLELDPRSCMKPTGASPPSVRRCSSESSRNFQPLGRATPFSPGTNSQMPIGRPIV